LAEILARKGKGQRNEDQTRIVDKLKKKERLTNNEFWSVYSSFRKEGPEVKYPNPQHVANNHERELNTSGNT